MSLVRLRVVSREIARVEAELAALRAERDRLALQAVDDGNTWRTVAHIAGFANPYIATLKRRRRLAASSSAGNDTP